MNMNEYYIYLIAESGCNAVYEGSFSQLSDTVQKNLSCSLIHTLYVRVRIIYG